SSGVQNAHAVHGGADSKIRIIDRKGTLGHQFYLLAPLLKSPRNNDAARKAETDAIVRLKVSRRRWQWVPIQVIWRCTCGQRGPAEWPQLSIGLIGTGFMGKTHMFGFAAVGSIFGLAAGT